MTLQRSPSPDLLARDPLPPPRPSLREEFVAHLLLWVLAPRLPFSSTSSPPATLEPYERLTILRNGRGGTLAAAWFPAPAGARGAVLLAHPWVEHGQAYFLRRGRIEALRDAGYHVMTFDLGGFGGSDLPDAFLDRDVEDALDTLAGLAGDLPLNVWGVSSGGYWAHLVLSRRGGVHGAVFEDVSPHLLEWSARTAPAFAFCYGIFRRFLPRAYRYLDLRRHAPTLQVAAAAYVGGELDAGVPPDDTRELARLAGAECLIVPGAPHLGAIKLARRQVIDLALATFGTARRDRE